MKFVAQNHNSAIISNTVITGKLFNVFIYRSFDDELSLIVIYLL